MKYFDREHTEDRLSTQILHHKINVMGGKLTGCKWQTDELTSMYFPVVTKKSYHHIGPS